MAAKKLSDNRTDLPPEYHRDKTPREIKRLQAEEKRAKTRKPANGREARRQGTGHQETLTGGRRELVARDLGKKQRLTSSGLETDKIWGGLKCTYAIPKSSRHLGMPTLS